MRMLTVFACALFVLLIAPTTAYADGARFYRVAEATQLMNSPEGEPIKDLGSSQILLYLGEKETTRPFSYWIKVQTLPIEVSGWVKHRDVHVYEGTVFGDIQGLNWDETWAFRATKQVSVAEHIFLETFDGSQTQNRVGPDTGLYAAGYFTRGLFLKKDSVWVRAIHHDWPLPVYGFLPRDAVQSAEHLNELKLAEGSPADALLNPPDPELAQFNRFSSLFKTAQSATQTTLPTAPLATAPLPTATPFSTPSPDINIPWMPETVLRWEDLIVEAAVNYGVDPKLVAIIVLVESGGNPGAASHVGAAGLMQVMPETATEIAERRGIQWNPSLISDPATNIDFGTWYLAQQLAGFGMLQDPDWRHSVWRAAGAYNGGPGHMSKHLNGAPLFAETAAYTGWVLGMWNERHNAESTTFTRWLEAGGWRLVAAAEEQMATP